MRKRKVQASLTSGLLREKWYEAITIHWVLYADQRTPFLDVDKMFGCLHLSFANLVACQFSMNF
jgi:hypothetical protein